MWRQRLRSDDFTFKLTFEAFINQKSSNNFSQCKPELQILIGFMTVIFVYPNLTNFFNFQELFQSCTKKEKCFIKFWSSLFHLFNYISTDSQIQIILMKSLNVCVFLTFQKTLLNYSNMKCYILYPCFLKDSKSHFLKVAKSHFKRHIFSGNQL